jgi:D-alanyl-D-alanine dipeptidase
MNPERTTMKRSSIPAFLAALACAPAVATTVHQAPPANTANLPVVADAVAETLLIDVRSLEPTIVVDMRYATADNFTGAVLPGYEANRTFLRREAAGALARVQRHAAAQGYGLQVYDGYRPVRATLIMVDWTRRVGREDLLRDEYIASRSRHNLGLAVNLTLVDRSSGRELAMGTPFDTLSAAAHTANATG